MTAAIATLGVYPAGLLLGWVSAQEHRAARFAHVYLLLLIIPAAIHLTAIALEPLHNVVGRAGKVLRTRLIGALAYLLVLVTLLPTIGTSGAALAAIVGAAVIRGQLAISAARMLRQ